MFLTIKNMPGVEMGKKNRGDRRDARYVKAEALGALMPFILKRRSDSLIYFDIKVNMENAIKFVKEQNESGIYPCKVTYFHLLLATLVKIMQTRPHLNSYILNYRKYERKHIDIAFVVKKQLTEEAKETTIKVRFDSCESFLDVVKKTMVDVSEARQESGSDNDKIYDILGKMPRFVTQMAVGILSFLHKIDRMPKDIDRADPMNSSAFLSNLGSIDVDAPFHHLFEWASCSLFACFGKIIKEPVVNEAGEIVVGDIAHIMVTVDERIGEGIKFAKDLQLFRYYMENPQNLLS